MTTRADGLVIVGDEAWFEEEYDEHRARLDRRNARERELRATDPEWAERERNWYRAYRAAHREKYREYERARRERIRAEKLAGQPVIIGSLHSLACKGPQKKLCRCTPMYIVKERAA